MNRRESFRSDESADEQGDLLEKRYQELSDEIHCRDGAPPAGSWWQQQQQRLHSMPRPSPNMKITCACLAAVGAISIGVKLLTLPTSSSSADLVKTATAASTLQMIEGDQTVIAAVPSDLDISEQRDNEVAKMEQVDESESYPPLTDFNTALSGKQHGVYIPQASSSYFADIWESIGTGDVPLYWDLEHTAGLSAREVLGRCYGFVLAGTNHLGEQVVEGGLQVVTHESGPRYITLDPNHPTGHQQAKKQDLIGSGLVDVLLTENLHGRSELFDQMHQGRIFAILRHPVDRDFSRYQELIAKGQISSDMPLLTWVESGEAGNPNSEDKEVNNPLVRTLANEPLGPLDERHVIAAKEFIRRKVIVGLAGKVFESFHRFEQYFGWGTSEDTDHCIQVWQDEEQRHWDADANSIATHLDRDAAVQELERIHWADLELYEYVRAIYDEQTILIDEAQVLRSSGEDRT